MTDSAGAVQIANFALARIGVAQTVTAIDGTDTSDAAIQCGLFYGQTRDALLRDFPWPWAQAFGSLVQISTVGERANAQWLYSYRYPTDCLYVRKIALPLLTDPTVTPPTPVTDLQPWTGAQYWLREDGDPLPQPFSIGHDTDGRLIFTDCPSATVFYTMAVTDTAQFSPDFASLLAWRLATEISYSLAISDNRRKWAEEKYQDELRKTRSAALNESQSDQPRIIMQSEVARARFGG